MGGAGLIQEFNALLFIGLLNCVAVFPDERNVYYRERADGTYSTLPFFLSYLTTELPFELLSSLIFTLIAVMAVGFNFTADNVFLYCFLFFCIVNTGESIGIAVCGVVYHPGVSVSITNVLLSCINLMAGVFSPAMPLVS
jgi:ABC-type multidrug transport system permease subunit